MTREEVLRKAIDVTTKDRNNQYGEPEDTFAVIADMWSSYKGTNFEPTDVAIMMVLMKCARMKHQWSEDSFVDIAGYAACGAEVASR